MKSSSSRLKELQTSNSGSDVIKSATEVHVGRPKRENTETFIIILTVCLCYCSYLFYYCCFYRNF